MNIKIEFNNTSYTIPDSALANATAALRSHLTSVMNGTGATIMLGGNSYNIDSTKLLTATNAFVSHLGTVAGNGYKVKINGIEYNVDSTKMADAVADLHAVLGSLVSGGDLNHDEIATGAYYANLNTLTFYDAMPDVISEGDVYIYGEYIYGYDSYTDGWHVTLVTAETGIQNYIPNYSLTDRNQSSYDDLLESINNKPVTNTSGTFKNCSNLIATPKVPSSLMSAQFAFEGCISLTDVTIPEGIFGLDWRIFAGCSALSSIRIPSSVTILRPIAFQNCVNLHDIIFDGTIEQWIAIEKNSEWNAGCGEITVTCTDGVIVIPAYDSDEMEVVFAEQALHFDNGTHTRPEYIDFSKYSEVTVVWNGAEWKVTPASADGFYFIGNAFLNDVGDDTGEPFFIVAAPPEVVGNDTGMTQFVSRDTSVDTHIVAIYKVN